METTIIDRLYLELSQFTKAKSAKEVRLEKRIQALRDALEGITDVRNTEQAEAMLAVIGSLPNCQEKDVSRICLTTLLAEYGEDKIHRLF